MKKFQSVIKETRRVAMLNLLGRNTKNVYVTANGEPCCIFGHALERLRLTGNLYRFNNYTFADLPWADWGYGEPSDAERLWSLRVQSSADGGDRWGMALLHAEMPAFAGFA